MDSLGRGHWRETAGQGVVERSLLCATCRGRKHSHLRAGVARLPPFPMGKPYGLCTELCCIPAPCWHMGERRRRRDRERRQEMQGGKEKSMEGVIRESNRSRAEVGAQGLCPATGSIPEVLSARVMAFTCSQPWGAMLREPDPQRPAQHHSMNPLQKYTGPVPAGLLPSPPRIRTQRHPSNVGVHGQSHSGATPGTCFQARFRSECRGTSRAQPPLLGTLG